MLKKRTQHSRYMPLIAIVAVVAVLGLIVSFSATSAIAAPPTEKDFFGIVFAVRGGILQVSSEEGVVDVATSDDTVVRLPLNPDAGLGDLLAGDNVAISLDDDFIATVIFVIPGKTQFRHVPGEVTFADDDTITLQPFTEGSRPISFNITPETQIKLRAGATELIEGVFAVVLARRDDLTGELLPGAIEIHVAAGAAKDPEPESDTPTNPDDIPEDEPENLARVTGIFGGLATPNNWFVGGTIIVVDADAKIASGIVVGQLIKVIGVLDSDGTLHALRIEAEEEDLQTPNRVRLEGQFESVNGDGTWTVGGTVVIIGHDTDTDGIPFVGQSVRIEGIILDNGSIAAREIENRVGSDEKLDTEAQVRVEGLLERVDREGNWIVNGIKVGVGEMTRLKGNPAVGSTVSIKAIVRGNRILALEIEIEDPRDDINPDVIGTAEFRGVVRDILDDGSIIINGRHILIQSQTEIEGEIVPRVMVKVSAVLLDNRTIVAKFIEVVDTNEGQEIDEQRKIRIEGQIEAVLDRTTIVVNGLTVVLGPRLRIGDLDSALGRHIRLEGVLQDDGTVLALRVRAIEREEDTESSSTTADVVESKDQKKSEPIKVEGFIARFGDGELTLKDGTKLVITPNTRVEGEPFRGAELVIEAFETTDGLVATKIKIEKPETEDFEGIITRFNNRRLELQGGIMFRVTADTRVDGNPTVGSTAKVRAFVFPDDPSIALDIKVINTDSLSDAPRVQSAQADSRPVPDADAKEEKREFDGIVAGREFNKIELRDGTILIITEDTKIRGRVSRGSVVKVKALVRPDGTVIALVIESEDDKARAGATRNTD